MCWNWQVSLTTWLVCLASGIFLIRRNKPYDITLGCLILAYSSMQLWETFMWWDQGCGTLNKVGTMGAYFALWSHVMAIGLGLYLEKRTPIPLIIGAGLMIFAIVRSFFIKFGCSKPSGTCHLKWGFDPNYYMLIFGMCVLISLIYVKPLTKGIIVSMMFIVTLLLSMFYSKSSVGTMWCFIAAIFAPIFILI